MFWNSNKLKIIECIGEGLNAHVYKVSKHHVDLNTDHVFALKVLKREADLGHFKKEFENLLKASGKRLVKYRGWERYKSKPGLLIEYIDGITLDELSKMQNMSQEEMNWIYNESLEGLKELSASGIFHGDLSLKNIMISCEGEIKLIDFGLSHWSTKKIEVTPEFVSPEVISGARPDLQSDIYSLNKIFNGLGRLQNAFIEPESPSSLCLKVKRVQKASSLQTQDNQIKSKYTPFKRQTKGCFREIALGLALSLIPTVAQNSILKEHSVLVRSSRWLSIKTDSSDWCFTPCKLNFQRSGLHTVYWKTKDQYGSIKVYPHLKNTIVNLGNENLETDENI